MSYGSAIVGDPAVQGLVTAPEPGSNSSCTNFILGFAFTYPNFAFYWDGAGPAFWRTSKESTVLQAVGTSWSNATVVPWETPVVLGANVKSQAAAAFDHTGYVPVEAASLTQDINRLQSQLDKLSAKHDGLNQFIDAHLALVSPNYAVHSYLRSSRGSYRLTLDRRACVSQVMGPEN
ncbi:hypothetical protein FB45DRAFT_1106570 [Roridomyces roridus]|uniref:Uncharacterized protein n=1 Tax=Roridomyces roridus TaxID=1738132 RepID=A0AAD7FEM2_9AGAR|nr:hypothetical protein FB45DRAFT_1106570 [Roridomyces roridus]